MTRFLDMTPTWAGIMPGLIACLQNGSGPGPAMAAEELCRLAAEVDSANAAAKAAKARPGMEETHARRGRALAARDLEGAARDFMAGGAFIRAACYWEAAARIAPPDMEEARDFRTSADLAEREAAAFSSRVLAMARAEERGNIAESLANAARDAEEGGSHARAAAFYAAAAIACPYSIHADSWGGKSRALQEAAQSGRAAAVKAAFAEGRREARDKGRDMARESYGMARACLAAYPEGPALPTSAAAARDMARDLRESLSDLVAALPAAIGAF